MKILIFILFILVSPSNESSYTVEEIKETYKDLFGVKVYEKHFTSLGPQDIKKGHILSDFYSENWGMVHYLELHYANIDQEHLNKYINNPHHINELYIRQLKNDEQFNTYFLTLIELYFQSSDIELIGFKPLAPDTITFEQLVSVASKFFMAHYIPEQDKYFMQVCAVTMDDLPKISNLNPLIEAFCFNTIRMFDEDMEEFNFFIDVDQAYKEVQSLDYSDTNGKEKQLRVRNEMYSRMADSKKLQDLLLKEYELKKYFLPFELIN